MKNSITFAALKNVMSHITNQFLKYSFLLILFPIIYSVSLAQTIEWAICLGGSNDDRCYSVQLTKDLGFIVAGITNSNDSDIVGNHGEMDIWVVKLNAKGLIQWQKSFGGSENDSANLIRQTKDGGYIIVGSTYSNDGDVTGNHGDYDYWIIKIDSIGSIQWQKCYGGRANDYASSLQLTNDNGYIIIGSTLSDDGDVSENHGSWDYWVVKVDSLGTLQWQKSLGGSNFDFAYDVQQTNEGGYIIAGSSFSVDGDITDNLGWRDYWIIKLNSVGNLEWQKSYGGSFSDDAFSIQNTNDDGFIITGRSWSNDGQVIGNHNGSADYWVAKIDSLGILEWQKSYGGSSEDYSYSIKLTKDGGYIVIGFVESNDGDILGNFGKEDFWIVKINSFGSIEWQESLGGSENDIAYDIQQTKDEGFIIAGESYSNDFDITNNHGGADFWIVKLSAPTDISETSNKVDNINIYPNPTENKLYLESGNLLFSTQIKIYNLFGELISEFKPDNSLIDNKIEIDMTNFAKGVYFLNILNPNGLTVKKIIKN